jgi:hypothetical protein
MPQDTPDNVQNPTPNNYQNYNYSLRVFGQVGSTSKMLESLNSGPQA